MNNEHMCKNCVFGENCYSYIDCEYYSPIGDDATDDYIDEMISEEMQEYREAWFEYIADYNDDFDFGSYEIK